MGLYLEFDPQSRLQLVEAASPAQVSWRGVRLVGRRLQELTREFDACGAVGVPEHDGVALLGEGFVLHAPTGVVEAVSAFRRAACRAACAADWRECEPPSACDLIALDMCTSAHTGCTQLCDA